MQDLDELLPIASRMRNAAAAVERAVADLNAATMELASAHAEYWSKAKLADTKDRVAHRNKISAATTQLLAACRLEIPRLVNHRAQVVTASVDSAMVALRGVAGGRDV
jgi:hypothetical protein